MYKPNFCAECGERITRARWHLWTNRRFCKDCAPRLRKSQIFFPLLIGAGLLSIGLFAGRSTRPASPPLIIERGAVSAVPAPAQNRTAGQASPKGTETGNAVPPEIVYGPDGTATERPTDPNETISICGARTKKGTPCSRRVRGTGRCWQHKNL